MKFRKENINNRRRNYKKIQEQIDIFGDIKIKKLYVLNFIIELKK